MGIDEWEGGGTPHRVRKCHRPPLCVAWSSEAWKSENRKAGRTHFCSLASLTHEGHTWRQSQTRMATTKWGSRGTTSRVSAQFEHSHHIKLLHGGSFSFFLEGKRKREKGRGLNRALAVDLKVCAGSSGRKSRPFKCD